MTTAELLAVQGLTDGTRKDDSLAEVCFLPLFIYSLKIKSLILTVNFIFIFSGR